MTAFLKPIEQPKGLFLRMGYMYTRKQFGKVLSPLSVYSARMPAAFTKFYGKIGKLDKKLELPADTAMLIREQVATINGCGYCVDANKWAALNNSQNGKANQAKIKALNDFTKSPLFNTSEQAALIYVSELTKNRKVSQATFDQLKASYTERQICDIVWIVATEHLYNLSNIGLNIGSDGICEPMQRD